MASTAVDSEIHGFLFSTDEMREIWSDKNWVQKWLDTEAALAKAQGELDVIPKEKADMINRYAKAELIDIPSIGEGYKSSITIVPILNAFKKILPADAGGIRALGCYQPGYRGYMDGPSGKGIF